MRNAFTIDLEDYFHVTAYADRLKPEDWDSCESRVERNAHRTLELLGAAKCRATFFVLGWVAEKYPGLVREIAHCGHEIACHSHRHRLVYTMSVEEFREDTRRAKQVIEDACGEPIQGYRAPSFSFRHDCLWAFDVLAELGFTYDSSVFPVRHPNYGMPDAPRFPFRVSTPHGSIVEFPMPTLELNRKRSPIGGGAYLRILPYWYTRWGLRFINEREKRPVCVYFHPWELDPDQPRLGGNPSARLRHYIGLGGTEAKLRRLLDDFEFCALGSLLSESAEREYSTVNFDAHDWAPKLSEIYDAIRTPETAPRRARPHATTIKSKPLLPDIGVIALVPDHWSDLWQPRHQVLSRLASYFHVVWVDPAQEWPEVFTSRRFSKPAKLRATNGFIVYVPPRWLPNLYRPQWLARLSLQQRLRHARRALLARHCKKIILYLWRPDFAPALECVPFDVSCYHIDDEYSFSSVDQPIDEIEKRLISEVRQVFIHSAGLLEKKGNLNPHTAYVPNGVDYQAYASPLPEPMDLATIPHPRIGYTGFLKRMLDWPLIMMLSVDHPEWSFVFVGPAHAHPEVTQAMEELSGRRNVHFLGGKPTPELAAYPQHFDVCIMPYRADDYTKYISPLKLHEYLASGRPVVGTRIRSLQEFSDVVSLANTPHDWSAAISEALSPAANTAERRGARQAVAQRYDWQRLVAQIAYFMAERLGREYVDRFSELVGPEFIPLAK